MSVVMAGALFALFVLVMALAGSQLARKTVILFGSLFGGLLIACFLIYLYK
jgi:hypothetical protein